MINLDAVENEEKFEEHFSKITSARQKSKSIFTDLQKKPNIMNLLHDEFPSLLFLSTSPFDQAPYPKASKEVGGRGVSFARRRGGKQFFSKSVSSDESGNAQSTKLFSHTSSNKKVVTCREYAEFSTSKASSVFPEKLGKVNKRSLHFRVSEGISDFISIRTISNGTSQVNFNESGRNWYSEPGNSGNVEERCNKISSTQHRQLVSKFNIYTPKKGLRASPCDEPEEIEQAHSLYPFQNAESFPLERNTFLKGDYACKIDLKDAYF